MLRCVVIIVFVVVLFVFVCVCCWCYKIPLQNLWRFSWSWIYICHQFREHSVLLRIKGLKERGLKSIHLYKFNILTGFKRHIEKAETLCKLAGADSLSSTVCVNIYIHWFLNLLYEYWRGMLCSDKLDRARITDSTSSSTKG